MTAAWGALWQALDWLALLGQFLLLSLLSVGGAITTVPDMHRTLVNQHQWLTDAQFNASIALAQAAPGPNVLFVALLGWHIGLNAAAGLGSAGLSGVSALLGVAVTMLGILLPSTTLTFVASRWCHQNRERRGVRAFKQGLAPVVVALMLATGWILTAAQGSQLRHWPLWLLTGVAALLVWQTRVHLLWLLSAGALLGWFNLI
ncbi:chromate transporter [Rhodoferax sp.]|uniref:chromate transporter n=1 Tax=Rhodoferax sp. TaxID=50421 RepID=UPI0026046A28|nr:chromate transporter [Rhodoferax sp.]MDD4942842.1 chromate transporter [Rhodoferax sp.]MDD5478700.1 chromate transporter [Rhodoferax sp.]